MDAGAIVVACFPVVDTAALVAVPFMPLTRQEAPARAVRGGVVHPQPIVIAWGEPVLGGAS